MKNLLGYWKNNMPFGFCRFINSDGDIYEGMNENFVANGKGTLMKINDYKYIGEWTNDLKNGTGEEFLSNGNEIRGTWENGVLKGYITLKYADGTNYTGHFQNDDLQYK